jgi:hypothetical protein
MIKIINFKYKEQVGDIIVNTTSRSNNWSQGLSPFLCGPVKLYGNYTSKNVENAWQYSKVYDSLDHLDQLKNPNSKYFEWAQAGWNAIRAERYPAGRNAIPNYCYWDNKKLDYINARKQVYVPLYAETVKNTEAFKKLEKLYRDKFDPIEDTLYLQDFDAHNLTPGAFTYVELYNNPHIKVGHGYVLAMLLDKFDWKNELK